MKRLALSVAALALLFTLVGCGSSSSSSVDAQSAPIAAAPTLPSGYKGGKPPGPLIYALGDVHNHPDNALLEAAWKKYKVLSEDADDKLD